MTIIRFTFSFLLLASFPLILPAQLLPGFTPSGIYDEQQLLIKDQPEGTRILINAPLKGFDGKSKIHIVYYALPNGSTIEQTIGSRQKGVDDPLSDAQHIGAQTRYLRSLLKNRTIVVIYLETVQHSWPSWKAATPGYREKVKGILDQTLAIFSEWDPVVTLNGHSGGGRFIFSCMDAFEEIPDYILRIGFLDSTYGYEDSVYGPKIARWLSKDKKRYLCALAYNDSVVIYNGKPLVSSTGGTWYRTRSMVNYLSETIRFRKQESDSLIWYTSGDKRVEIILKKNPEGKIFHTLQVAQNGFIHSMLSGTRYEQKGYTYFGRRVYGDFIADSVVSLPSP